MEWTKVTITTDAHDVDVISSQLNDMGICGVEIIDPLEAQQFMAESKSQWDYIDEELASSLAKASLDMTTKLIFYIGTDNNSKTLLSNVKRKINSKIATETVKDEDWLHEWKKHFHPLQIGKVLIVPEWDKGAHASDVVFRIDPGSAFGTGQHATTMLCVHALQDRIISGDTVLDIGCGSGILSIISLLLGADTVISCDIDPAAIEVTRRNAQLNPVNTNQLQVHVGDILSSPQLQKDIQERKYKVIAANIVADVIIKLAPAIPALLDIGGVFIASGIITERIADVLAAYADCGLMVLEEKSSEGWCCLVAHG